MQIATKLCFIILSLLMTFSAFGQKPAVSIKFNIDNYESDTLLVGYYYGQRTLVLDTLLATKKGKFLLEKDEPLKHGVYLALYQPDNHYFQFMVSSDQEFSLRGNAETDEVVPAGDKDNQAFYDYLQFISSKSRERKMLSDELDKSKAQGKKTDKIIAEMDKLDVIVKAMQEKIVNSNPEFTTSKLLKSNFSTDIPEYSGTPDEIQEKKYLFYKKNYFNNIDLGDPAIIRTPFLHERITYYEEKLTPQHPDSLKISINYLLNKMEPSEETFRYYLSHFLNKYANSKIIGFDALYVYLIDEYYSKDKAPWVSEENMTKFKENADKLRPILLGEPAPKISFYNEDGSPNKLYDIDSEFTVLIFWAPDCGHCKKSMPGIIEFYEKYKEKGVEIMAVCTKHRDKYPKCWEYVKEQDLPWINVADEFHRSNFREKYNVVATPRVFILDKDKKILFKRVPTEQLDAIMEALINEMDNKIINDQN